MVVSDLNNFSEIKFIHVGKCAGTFLVQNFKFSEIHLRKPEFDPKFKYVIWLRNPISRFVSAFNHSHFLVNLDISNYDINNLTIDNCFAPVWIRKKILEGNTFGHEYDSLVRYFKTANNLAESLGHHDKDVKQNALKLMNFKKEHIFKGIGWYLDNGDFIEKHSDNILFVGAVENMEKDLKRLETLLDYKVLDRSKVRENRNRDRYLSSDAVRNILSFYNDTDYRALKALLNLGLISDDLYNSYFEYYENTN